MCLKAILIKPPSLGALFVHFLCRLVVADLFCRLVEKHSGNREEEFKLRPEELAIRREEAMNARIVAEGQTESDDGTHGEASRLQEID